MRVFVIIFLLHIRDLSIAKSIAILGIETLSLTPLLQIYNITNIVDNYKESLKSNMNSLKYLKFKILRICETKILKRIILNLNHFILYIFINT